MPLISGLWCRFKRRLLFVALAMALTILVYASLSYSVLHQNKTKYSGFAQYPHKITLPPKKAIPKIIHQIWSDNIIPEEFVDHVKSMIKYNPYPQWEYYFWTLEIGRHFIEKKFPKMLKIYDSAKLLQKAEFLRMAVVYYYGGAYFDLDVFCLRPLERFVENHECALIAPIPEFFVAYAKKIDPFDVNNAIFLCRQGHPFFKILVTRKENLSETCFSRSSQTKDCNMIEFAQPILEMYSSSGNTSILPELVDFRLFDSIYDPIIEQMLEEKCTTNIYFNLDKVKRTICDNWVKLGKGNRLVYENAYTYHTWYHTKAKPVTIDSKNSIQNIVPHAKIYNPVMDAHFVLG